METGKALIGMSGGVDSSVAAYLTKNTGISCTGVTMRLYAKETDSHDDAEDARCVAARLEMPFEVMDFQPEFRKCVLDDFVRSYESGCTPNPCIVCNRKLKFGALLEKALELGFDWVVTGHYARIRRDPDTGRYLLCKAADSTKDQSYFLACLSQHQLSHIRFPLGELTKQEVRAIAEKMGFVNARKRDSQDICFIPDGDYAAFLQRYTGKAYAQGRYLDLAGNTVGTHNGAVCYTLGQRKGLGIALGTPVYVCAKDMAANTVTVGPNEALFTNALRADNWNWFPFPALAEPMEVSVKVRHSQKEVTATVYPEPDGFARVEFTEPQRAVTPGQAVVLYQGDTVIGGGTIRQAYTI